MDLDTTVRRYLDGRLSSPRLRDELAGSSHPDVDLWIGVACLDDGDDDGAVHSLDRWLSSPAAQADTERRSLASVLLIMARSGPVEAVRWTLRSFGPRWRGYCPLPLDTLVLEVADADPTLLASVVADLPTGERPGPEACAAGARTLLTLAVEAKHSGAAAAHLTSAEWLLGGV